MKYNLNGENQILKRLWQDGADINSNIYLFAKKLLLILPASPESQF